MSIGPLKIIQRPYWGKERFSLAIDGPPSFVQSEKVVWDPTIDNWLFISGDGGSFACDPPLFDSLA
jgi:hypothetical protein